MTNQLHKKMLGTSKKNKRTHSKDSSQKCLKNFKFFLGR